MTLNNTRTGTCLCGRVRYRLVGEPLLVGLCHCADCRKESGSMFTTYAKWPIENFAVEGETRVFKGRSFCPHCGSRLFNLHERDVEVRIGSLNDAPTHLMPMQEGWTRRRETWLSPVPGVLEASEDPPR